MEIRIRHLEGVLFYIGRQRQLAAYPVAHVGEKQRATAAIFWRCLGDDQDAGEGISAGEDIRVPEVQQLRRRRLLDQVAAQRRGVVGAQPLVGRDEAQ